MPMSIGFRRRRHRSLSRRRSAMKQWAALLAVGAFLLLAGASEAQPTLDVRWQQFVRLPGVLDVAGPRADGRFVVATGAGLFLLNRSGLLAPYARGGSGYVPARGETYIALARARHLPQARCSFRRDDVYALDPVDHPGITMIDPAGKTRRFAELAPGSF